MKTNPLALNPNKVGIAAFCTKCRRQKTPRGRSAPLIPMCDFECEGYDQEPRVGDLWPAESEAEFGYLCGDEATRILGTGVLTVAPAAKEDGIPEEPPSMGVKPETCVRLIDKLNDWLITHRSFDLRVGETPVDTVIRLIGIPNYSSLTYADGYKQGREDEARDAKNYPVASLQEPEGATHEWLGCEEVNDWFVASCSCGWTYQHPNYGTTQETFVNHWGDHIAAELRKLCSQESK